MARTDEVAGILLTGGSSRRMGRDKAQLVVGNTSLARRNADLLQQVTDTAIEVGPGHSGLRVTREVPAGEGPLAAIAAGRRTLHEAGHDGAALVIACDLPFLSLALLAFLAEYDAPGTVLPVVDGRVQPLCARWGAFELDQASELVASGVRSLRHLVDQPDVTLIDESTWGHVATAKTFADLDSPEDLVRYGLTSRTYQT